VKKLTDEEIKALLLEKVGFPMSDAQYNTGILGYRLKESEALKEIEAFEKLQVTSQALIGQQQSVNEKMTLKICELEAEIKSWKDRFKAIVGEDSVDMAGNKVIALQSKCHWMAKDINSLIVRLVKFPQNEIDKAVRYSDVRAIIEKYGRE
jgi:hypothetical protein